MLVGKLKLVEEWYTFLLENQEGRKFKLRNGCTISYDGQVGKFYQLQDKSSHNGGHGMGQIKSSQALFVFGENNLAIMQTNGEYIIEIIEGGESV